MKQTQHPFRRANPMLKNWLGQRNGGRRAACTGQQSHVREAKAFLWRGCHTAAASAIQGQWLKERMAEKP
eukprot:604854-Amphidinium_carterae.1